MTTRMHETVPLDGICVARLPLLPLDIAESLLTAAHPLDVVRDVLAARSDCRIAILLASPELYRAMNEWLAGKAPSNAKAPSKLLAYMLRMSARPTPFGLFAGVADVAVSGTQTLALRPPDARNVRFRPDAEWLQRRVAPVFDDPERRDAIRVVASDAYREHDGRVFVTAFRDDGADRVSLRSPPSMRKTSAVDAALTSCAGAMRYGDVILSLAETFTVAPVVARRLVDDMWNCGLLIPELRAPPFGPALDHVLAHLPAAELGLRAALEGDRARLQRLSATTPAEDEVAETLAAMSAAVSECEHAVQVDSHVTLDGTLQAAVLADVARLGSLLLRNGDPPRMRAFEDAWQRRFDSPGVLVPLLDALDPDTGLGDARLLDITSDERPDIAGVRLEAVAGALATGSDEIVLTAADCERWFPAVSGRAPIPSTIEVGFTLLAESAGAVDAGEFRIASTALATSTAGRTLGRFADLLPATMARVRSALRDYGDGDAIHAEVIYPVPHARRGNVSARALIHPYVIALGVQTNAGERLDPRELFVGRDERGFFLFSRAHGKRVIPHESHVMTIPGDTPPVCRFLSFLARQDVAPRPFAWGALDRAPALPRLRTGRIILSPRRWRIPADRFAGATAEAVAAIRAWRERWTCPALVRFGDGDQLIPVNLDAPEFVALIRDLRGPSATEPVIVYERLESASTSVVRGDGGTYAAEFVASFATSPRTKTEAGKIESPTADTLTNETAKTQPGTTETATAETATIETAKLLLGMPPAFGLDSDYVYVKLYCATHRTDRALTASIGPAMEAVIEGGLADRWFFVRYADPDPHLRVRVHATPGSSAALRSEVFRQTGNWLRSGWCYRVAADTYVPETHRYGGPDALPLVECWFMESSRASIAALVPAPAETRERIRRGVVTARALFAPLVDRLGIPWWLATFAETAPKRDRAFRADRAALAATERAALAAAERAGGSSRAGRDLDDLLDLVDVRSNAGSMVRALLHMHFNRVGLDHDGEAIARDLLRDRYRSALVRYTTEIVP
jgi:thiopeptide-type bacteriocin biosynthesis protein